MIRPANLDRRGVTWGLLAVVVALVLLVLGSSGLRWFDAALVGYLFGTLFAIVGVTYRDDPRPRRLESPRADLHPSAVVGALDRAQVVFWGCVLAALVTFPLVFGCLHFESVGQDAHRYRAYVTDWGTVSFDARSVAGWITFHLLDIAAVLVLAGVFVFLVRRLRDPDALAVERSSRSPACSRSRSPG